MTATLAELRARLRREILSPARYVDAKLEVRAHDGEVLFVVGGRWDHIGHCYVEGECAPRVVKLKKSQSAAGKAIGEYIRKRLAHDDSRVALLLFIGNRGGGKTHLLAVLLVAIALALPRSYQIGVSITAKQNRELRAAIGKVAPPEWVAGDVVDLRDPHTDLVTGSTLMWHTAKNWKALRQALLPFEHIAINEGQDQREEVFANAIGAIREGGVLTVAANPPSEGAGDWVAILFQQLDAGNRDGAAFILDAADNDAVSAPMLGKIERLLRAVSPSRADADSLGIIKLSGDIAYPGFTRRPRVEDSAGRWIEGHIGDPPAEVVSIDGKQIANWVDVTRQETAKATGASAGFDYVGGSDFQTDPGNCAAIGKLYRTPAGDLVLHVRECVVSAGVEEDLTRALNARGYYPGPVDYEGKPAASLVLVGDATGARQNAEHRKRDPYSYTRLRADGWTVIPPYMHRNQKRELTPMNPLVLDSRKQMKAVFVTGAILISPRCAEAEPPFPSLIESLARAKVTAGGHFEKARHDHFTHLPDAVRYLAWRFLPRKAPAPAPGPSFNHAAFDALRKIRVLGRGDRE